MKRARQSGGRLLLIAVVIFASLIASASNANAADCPCSIWSAAVDPGTEAPDTSAVNLGIKFQSDVAGYIKGVRFYKHVDNTGTHTGYLWTEAGALLGSVTFQNETATGWQEADFATPIAISANTTYVASYYAPNSHWAHNINYFNHLGVDSPPLHVTGGLANNGVSYNSAFRYGSAGLFPTDVGPDHAANYMVDVVFDTTAAPSTIAPTATIGMTNAADGVDPNANITVDFSKEIDATTLTSTNVQLLDGATPIATTISYPEWASNATATIIPSSVLTLSHAYTVVIKGGAGGVKDLAGNPLAGDVTNPFTTASALPAYACPCTLWTPATGNGGAESADVFEVTLGVKFQSDANGYIKGVRFFKGPDNTGTHYGYLFSASGQILAKATFANETASGWQEVRFATPVQITRHTTYVAAYYTLAGHWNNSRPYFEAGPYLNFPLQAQQNLDRNADVPSFSPNSVYVYGAPDRFPNQDPLDAPNYWIDPIFDTVGSDAPQITSASAATFTAGTSGTFPVTTTGFPTPSITVTGTLPVGVTFIDNGNGTGRLSGTPASNSGGTYAITFTASNSAGNQLQDFTLTVDQAPAITASASNQTVCSGASASFTAAADGFPTPAVQWQVSTDGGATFANILNATSPTYTFATTPADNGNRYQAVFTNAAGTATTSALLTVNTAPVVNANPASQSVCSGMTATFTASATGASSVQWQISTNGGASFTDIAGATAAAYSFSAQASDNANEYRAVFTNSCGSTPSSAATLTVTGPPSVTTNPADQTVCAGSQATFIAASTGTPASTVQWEVSTDGGATFTNIAGATSLTYSFVTTDADNAKKYRATFTNACGSTNSSSALLTVNALPATPAITAGGPTTFCAGGSVTLTSSSASGNQWFLDGTPVGTGTTYSATTSGNYTVVVTANGCTSAPSAPVSVVVNPIPPAPTVTAGGSTTFCDGGSVTLTSSSATGNAWYVNATLVGNGATYVATASGSYTVVVTANGCASAPSAAVNVTVNPIPPAPTITPSGPTTFCDGGSVTLTSSSAAGNQWFLNGTLVGTGSSYVATASGSYTAVVTASGCSSGPSASVNVTVNPIPAAPTASNSGPYCAGSTVSLSASTIAGATYAWSGPNGFTSSLQNPTISNATTAASGTYSVTATVNGCPSAAAATTVTVNSVPAAPTAANGGPYCAGSTVSLTASTVAGATYAWTGPNNFTSSLQNPTIPNATTTTSGTYSVTVTVNGCPSAAGTTTVAVNAIPPTPTITPSGPTTFCAGGSVTLASSSASGNQWYLNGSPISGATAATYSASASGSYTVVVTTSGCSSAASGPVSVTVNPIPPAPTVSAGGATTFCAGGSVTLTSSSLTGNQWYLNNAPISGATGNQYSATASGSYTVIATANGCPSPASAPVSVTVNPNPPTPVITAPAAVNPDSTGNTASGPAGAASYSWSIVNGTITSAANTQNITFTAGAFASLTLNLTVTNATGCSSTSSRDVTITTNQPPVATNDSYSTTTNTPLSGDVTSNDTDAEHDPIMTLLTANVTNGSLALNSNGTFTYTPAASFNGTDTFKYRARDAGVMTTSDDSLADFQAGTIDGCTAATLGNGDVVLTPASGGTVQTFTGTSTPMGWSSSGSATVSGGSLVLAGGTLRFDTQIATPAAGQVRSLEFVATFLAAPNQQAGFGVGGAGNILTSGSYWAMFSTGSTGDQLYVRTSNNSPESRLALGTSLLGAPHKFRVEWSGAGSVSYYVDNVFEVTHTFNPPNSGNNKVFIAANDNTTDTSSLSVDWMRIGPYNSPCTFTSRVHDADGTSWKTLAATTSLPSTSSTSTTIAFQTRTGSTPTPDASWSGWSATSGTTITSPAARYLQYQATLATTDGNSPTLDKVVLTADPPLSNEATVTITVRPPNTPPVAANDSYTTCQGIAVTVNAPGVLANDTDADGNSLTAVLAGGPSHAASFTLNANGSFSYTPAAAFSGTDSFTYFANDGTVNSNTPATVTITINATPATPAASNGGPYCEGATISLTTPAVSGATYTWTGPNSFTSSQQNPTIANATTAMSGTYSVTVTVNGCPSAPGTTAVVVNAIPATPVASNGGPYCAGSTIALSTPAVAGATYAWTGPNGFTSNQQNPTIANAAVVNGGTYSVTVTVNGCGSAAGTTTVVVNPLPAPSITAGGPTTFCAGGSVTLTASAAASYLWSTGANTQSITVSTSGNYTVTVTDANGCSGTSAATSVTVNPLPTATITANGPTAFCAGGSVTLTSSAGASYLWSNGATTQSTTVSTSGNYTVTVTDANGCSATSAATTVVVNALPTPTITPSGATTFCAGGSVTLTASAGTSYLWSTGETTPSITVSTSGNYSVTVTDANGCSGASAATTVTVNPLPAATITAAGPLSFCQGGTVTLNASNGASYHWSTGESTQSITVANSGSYTVIVTDASGCSNTSDATVVTVNPPPTVTINAGGPTTFCAGGSVTLTASGGTSYSWSTGATTPSITVDTSGTYTVTATDANGCSATASKNVTVNAPPAPTINASGPTTFCAGGSVTLTSSAGASYLWSNGAITQSITVSASGTYSVTVTDANGCSAMTSQSVTVNPLPVPTISANGPTTFCAGGSVILTSSAAASYLWSNGAITQSITVTTSGNYSVTVTDANGCSGASAATSVIVNPLPATPVASNAGPYCDGATVSLTTATVPGATYSWSGPNAFTSALQNPTILNATTAASGTYSVTVTTNGCTSAAGTTTVVVNPTPQTPLITASGPTAFCAGGSVTLTSSSTTGNQWYLNGAPISGATAQTYAATDTGNYTVVVTTSSCSSAASAATNITVNPLPDATVTAPAVVNANSTGNPAGGPAGMTAYNWSIANGAITSAANTQNISFTAGPSGSVTLTLTTTNGSGCTATSSSSVPVNRVPVAANDSYTVVQNTTLSVPAPGVLANDSDADGNALSVTLLTGAAHGSVTLNADGSFTYVPQTNYYGPDQFTYRASDGVASSNSATVSIDVYQSSVTQSATLGGTVTTDPLNNGATPTDPLQTSVTLPPALSGSVSISTGVTGPADVPPATYTFFDYEAAISAPAATAAAPLVLSFRLDASIIPAGQNQNTVQVFRDGAAVANCSSTAGSAASPDPCIDARTLLGDGDVVLEVRSSHASDWNFGRTTLNTAPVAGNDSYSVCANTPLTVGAPGVLANDTDSDRNTLTAALITSPAHAAAFTLNPDGSFTYTPASGFSGTDTFTYAPNDGTVNGNTATVTITTDSTPAPTITVSGATTFCAGGQVTLSSSNATGNQWYRNGSPISGATAQTYIATTSGDYTVVATATCPSAPSAATTVTVDAPPATPSITSAPSVCANSTGNTASGPAGFTYLWSVTNGTITSGQTQQTVTYTAGPTGPVTLRLTVTNNSGCSASNSASVNVNASAAPSISAPPYVTTNTTGNQASGPPGMSGYAWSIAGGGTITAGANTQTVTFTAGAPGTLTLTLVTTNASGCSASNTANVTVYAQPTINIDSPTQKAPAKGSTAPMVFTVTLSNPSSQTVTVAYNTSNGTAVAGTDYVATSGTLTFSGSTSQTITVTIKGTGATTTKTFWMNLSNPTNATIATVSGYPVRGKGTINP